MRYIINNDKKVSNALIEERKFVYFRMFLNMDANLIYFQDRNVKLTLRTTNNKLLIITIMKK